MSTRCSSVPPAITPSSVLPAWSRNRVRPGSGRGWRSRPRGPRSRPPCWWSGSRIRTNPLVLLTDLHPAEVGLIWYGLRFWIECGFRIIKGMGWQWQKSQRTDPDRVARHWLVLAMATTWVLATGTRVKDATSLDRLPAHLHAPPARVLLAGGTSPRSLSVFQQGLRALQEQLHHTRLWRVLWLAPEPWPADPPGLTVTRHDGAAGAA